MPVRRGADPVSVQNVWDAIRVANAQKQMADSNRICKYLQKMLLCSQVQAELYLKQTLQDELILAVHKVTVKGTNAGNEVESYKIPSQEQENLLHTDHDWYCIDCHLAGDVSLCVTCHRAFHAECAHKKQILSKQALPHRNTVNNNRSSLEPNRLPEPLLIIKTPEAINATSSNGILEISSNDEHDTICDRTNEVSDSVNEDSIHNGIQNSSETNHDDYYDEAVCSICNLSRRDTELLVEQNELNHLLTFIFNRIKSWIPIDLTNHLEPNEVIPDWCNEKERKWRCDKLLYENINIPFVGKKLEANEYRQPYEFKVDMLTIQHNIAIYHGTETQEYHASEFLLKDCLYEIAELTNCLDCYKNSNEKSNEDWFCIPCRNPHKLVWAKQLGHPYWPAKVLKETDKSCDVRFFGGKYERALLSKTHIKPIEVSMSSLNIKKKPGFNKAVKELLLHQQLLKNARTSDIDIKNMEGKEQLEKSISRKRKSTPTTYKSYKIKKRSHSVDNLSEEPNKHTARTTKRRNSSATLNNHVGTSRVIEYPTRQTLKNKKKRKKSNAVAASQPIDSNTDVYNYEEKNSTTMNNVPVEEFNGKINNTNEGNHEEVTSSSETVKLCEEIFQDVDNKMPKPERQYSESVEKTRRKLEECIDKDELIKTALECMQREIDRISNEHDINLRRIIENNNALISETKKKQWCYNCEQDAIYHCCWNTAYCSLPCQQQHWQSEHKRVCRRKR